MSRPNSPEVRIALLASQPKARWRGWLNEHGVQVILEGALASVDPNSNEFSQVQALLVDLGNATDNDLDAFDAILEAQDLPLVFADPGTWESGDKPGAKLADKIRDAVFPDQEPEQALDDASEDGDYEWNFSLEDPAAQQESKPDTVYQPAPIPHEMTPEEEEAYIAAEVEALGLVEEEPEVDIDLSLEDELVDEAEVAQETAEAILEEKEAQSEWGQGPSAEEIELAAFILSDASMKAANDDEIEKPVEVLTQTAASKTPVWALGSSLGGPEAVKKFLSRLPEETDAIFILGQHIGKGFDQLLSEQLNRNCALTVKLAQSGVPLEPRHVYVVPVEGKLKIRDGEFVIEQDSEKHLYTPCIDAMMEEVAAVYGRTANAIVFTGMGADGAKGAAAIADKGGVVWAQSHESCAMPSMPDSTRAEGCVSFSDSPEHLAIRLTNHLNANQVVA